MYMRISNRIFRSISPLAFLSGVLCSMVIPLGHAATPIDTSRQPLPSMSSPASLLLSDTHGFHTTTSPYTYQTLQTRTDTNGTTHKRLQQKYLNIPVWGAHVLSHKKDLQGFFQFFAPRFNGVVYKDLENDLGEMPHGFLQPQSQSLMQRMPIATKQAKLHSVTPSIYVDKHKRAHWVHIVTWTVQNSKGMPQRPSAIVDAETMHIYRQWENIKSHSKAAVGIGFGGNPILGQIQYGHSKPALRIRRDDNEICYLENPSTKVIDMKNIVDLCWFDDENCEPIPQESFQFSCPEDRMHLSGEFWTGKTMDGLDPINGAYSPSNDALAIGDIITRMYQDWYHVPALVDENGNAKQLIMRVHFMENFANAFWDGEQMTFGDGDEDIYPLVSLSIGAHEVSHGFTQQHSGLIYEGQSGGIDESFSDMAAIAAQYYSKEKVTWRLGDGIMKDGSALRYMDQPSKDGRSIDRADQYNDYLDVHHSSGVFNHLFYRIANQPDWNVRKAFNIMVKANMDYWTPEATFESAACGVLNATHDYGYALEDVRQQLDAVAIAHDHCVVYE